MFKKVICSLSILSILVLSLCSCSEKLGMSKMEKIQNMLTDMETYEAETEFSVISNKGETIYKAIQTADKNGRYKIDMLSPENVNGNYTIFDGQSVCQYNKSLDKKIKVDMPDLKGRNEIILFNFVENYLNSEGVALETASMEESTYTVLEAVIPGGLELLATEKLFVNNETLLPEKLIIYDKNGNERYIIVYKNFEYNKELDENIFNISNY